MGDVYLAERAAGDFDQQVAIKLVRRDLASPAVTRRFTEERRILARLRHPSIATMFGGGLTDDGRPYLVMEYVDGVPLDRYCVDHELSIERRVDLVIAACHAVAHAHAQRTVHCDLKPDNVLVTSDGEVKLLDFGIATVLEDDDGRATDRADPDVRGARGARRPAAVDRRRRVLARRRAPPPARRRGATPARRWRPRRARAALLRTATPPPSLPSADLDAICRRAMAPLPADRYPSVAALADDLARMRAHRPVEARRRTVATSPRGFVRRHTAATARRGGDDRWRSRCSSCSTRSASPASATAPASRDRPRARGLRCRRGHAHRGRSQRGARRAAVGARAVPPRRAPRRRLGSRPIPTSRAAARGARRGPPSLGE